MKILYKPIFIHADIQTGIIVEFHWNLSFRWQLENFTIFGKIFQPAVFFLVFDLQSGVQHIDLSCTVHYADGLKLNVIADYPVAKSIIVNSGRDILGVIHIIVPYLLIIGKEVV